ncbi:L-lactate permease [Raoultella planticola]|uniref:L-lactate permease n=1 Tax=Raoultella planticola TaxID=575 RepID=A0A485BN19_RAOPL|nr:L-lactate permease [Raoultella planticola]
MSAPPPLTRRCISSTGCLPTGTAILVCGYTFRRLAAYEPKDALITFGSTLKELALPIYSIGMVLAFAFISNYSGLSSTLALALAHTGHAFTFFSPFLGWLGVFLTGSDTSSNALFAALQATAAQQIGVSDISAGRGQHHRRRHRQNDFAAVHRYRLCGGRPGGERVGPVPLYRKTQA